MKHNAERGLEIAAELDEQGWVCGVLHHQKAVALLHLGDVGEALPLLTRAAELLEPTGGSDLCTVMLTMAEIAVEVDDVASAESMYGNVLERLASTEPTSPQHAQLLNLLKAKAFIGFASASARQSKRDQAGDYLARASEFLDVQSGDGQHVELLEHSLELWRLLGDPDAVAAAEEELAALRSKQPAPASN